VIIGSPLHLGDLCGLILRMHELCSLEDGIISAHMYSYGL
jgi:hypothetical protein